MTDNTRTAADITDEMADEARSLIGVWLRRDVHTPAVAEDIAPIDIRRWAMYSVGDDNPLWSDDEYARRTIWGGIVAPPTFLYTIDSTIIAPGLRGIQWIYGGTRWEHHVPVRVGDRITARARLIKVTEKTGSHAKRFIVQTGETLYFNQRDELVSRAEADVLRIPRKGSGKGLVGFESRKAAGRQKYTPEQIEEVRQAYLSQKPRGSKPLYWESVCVGDELPPIPKGPLTIVDIMAFYVGRRNTYPPLKLAFAERERHPANVFVSPSTGIPVHPAAGHLDEEIAHEVGMPGIYDQGWMRANWLGHLITDWCGDHGFVRKLGIRLQLPNLIGDLTWCRGIVVRKYVENDEHLVDIECWGENQRGERNVQGTATVRLPSKDVSSLEGVRRG
ncbi:MaoC family dehydratase N-terminal domain-containing protein [Streptosporangium sp. NPDC087985]|uniref:FAS1-like dehydratase domain-containing protein n=1 Tax=Streptosporangium sp. NPDC087985 TaxID=3366196 RepID=UPI0038074361